MPCCCSTLPHAGHPASHLADCDGWLAEAAARAAGHLALAARTRPPLAGPRARDRRLDALCHRAATKQAKESTSATRSRRALRSCGAGRNRCARRWLAVSSRSRAFSARILPARDDLRAALAHALERLLRMARGRSLRNFPSRRLMMPQYPTVLIRIRAEANEKRGGKTHVEPSHPVPATAALRAPGWPLPPLRRRSS